MAEQKTQKKEEKPKKVENQPTQEQQQSDMMSYLNRLRSNIILAYDGSKDTAVKSFDEISTKLIQYVRYAQKSDEMIAELKKQIEEFKKK